MQVEFKAAPEQEVVELSIEQLDEVSGGYPIHPPVPTVR